MSSNTLQAEVYRYNHVPMTPAQYDYSIHAFLCPACERGLQRPKANLNLPFDQWIYWCEVCDGRGTRQEIQNSVRFSNTLRRVDCKICGGKSVLRPAPDRMQYDWWTTLSREWIRRCDSCKFTGTLWDFEVEAFRRSEVNEDAENAADMRHPVW